MREGVGCLFQNQLSARTHTHTHTHTHRSLLIISHTTTHRSHFVSPGKLTHPRRVSCYDLTRSGIQTFVCTSARQCFFSTSMRKAINRTSLKPPPLKNTIMGYVFWGFLIQSLCSITAFPYSLYHLLDSQTLSDCVASTNSRWKWTVSFCCCVGPSFFKGTKCLKYETFPPVLPGN